jgi:hypothetical protein
VSDLAAALQIAIKVHAGQRDKQGAPYLLHVLRVVEAVSDEAEPVAALHDVLEDHDLGVAALAPVRLSEVEWQALALLTRDKQEDYAHYIAQIASEDAGTWTHQKGVLLARGVKLADLRDNLGRIPLPPSPAHPDGFAALARWQQEWQWLKVRYERAIATLEQGTKPASTEGER